MNIRATILSVLIVISLATMCGPHLNKGDDGDTEAGNIPRGPYLGQTPPGETPRLFAPGIISTGLHDDGSPIFSPDLKEVYFRKFAYPHDIIGYMKQVEGKWSEPTLFKPAGEHVVLTPVFIPGTHKAVFTSRMPVPGKPEAAGFNPWIAEKNASGWSEFQYAGSLAPEGKYYIATSAGPDSTLYFHADLDAGLGGYDIYYSEYRDGHYQALVNLGAPVNTRNMERGPCISPDGTYLLYCANGDEDNLGGFDLYVAFKKNDGSWTRGYNLGEGINTADTEKFPAISPDGKYFFFVAGRKRERQFVYSEHSYKEMMQLNLGPENGLGDDVYWCSTRVIDRLKERVRH